MTNLPFEIEELIVVNPWFRTYEIRFGDTWFMYVTWTTTQNYLFTSLWPHKPIRRQYRPSRGSKRIVFWRSSFTSVHRSVLLTLLGADDLTAFDKNFEEKTPGGITISLSKLADLVDRCWPISPVPFFVRICHPPSIIWHLFGTTVVHVYCTL